ncbi:MAG: hypothetical protein JW966_05600 [Anaerolineae bacterium]|nr:hypothetical protein [Anaerolineae bacterium]
MSDMGCLAAMADGLFAVCAYVADTIASSLGIDGHGAGWAFSFLLAIVAVVGLIALIIYLLI